MAVRIRMKKLGRKHRPFFRICAVDSRAPRDGRVIEELGTYDPMNPETDARTTMNDERISYWIGVGAQPSDKIKVLIKKYGPDGTHLEQQKAARERQTVPKAIPDQGPPVFTLKQSKAKAAAPAAELAAAPPEKPADAPVAEGAVVAEEAVVAQAEDASAEAPAEAAAAEEPSAEESVPSAEESVPSAEESVPSAEESTAEEKSESSD